MPVNLSIKNVPEDVHEALKDRASRNKRSLNNEILHVLEASVQRKRDVDAQIKRLQALRAQQQFETTTEEIVAIIREVRDRR
ncbi:MAG: Arc family DNA-binding protein [Bacteroidetes bacterium]|nr:Arc family DNA-binding protein [Bacteroidota bacterium]MDA0875518.1 Arc family DNA-binding protein [Bacteroidota bacterium]